MRAMVTTLALVSSCMVGAWAQDAGETSESQVRSCYAHGSDALGGGITDAYLDIYAEDFLGPMGATAADRRAAAEILVRDSLDRSIVFTIEDIQANGESAAVVVTEALQAFDRSLAIPVERRRRVLHRWQDVGGAWKLVRETELDTGASRLSAGDQFSDSVYGFSTRVPAGFFGYVCAIRSGRQVAMVSPDLAVDLDVMGHKLNDRLNPQFLALVGAQAMREMVPNYRLEGLAEATLGGAAAVKSVSTYTRGGRQVLGEVTIVTQGRQVFSVGVTACPPNAKDKHGAAIDSVLRGLVVSETTERLPAPPRGVLDGASFYHEVFGVRFTAPTGWTVSLGDAWDAQVYCESPDGQGTITLGCLRIADPAPADEDPRLVAEDLLMGFDEAVMGRADSCQQLAISDKEIAGHAAVQSTTEFTLGEQTRRRLLTVVVSGDVAVVIVADDLSNQNVASLEPAMKAAISSLGFERGE